MQIGQSCYWHACCKVNRHDMTARPDRLRSARSAELVSSLLRDGLDVRLRLSGWSMKPIVASSSIVRFASSERLSVGDIVLARCADDSLVAHRVVAIDDRNIWTKGDACRTADAPFSREQILGSAVELRGLPVSLRSRFMRWAGLVVNRCYPGLVVLYRRLWPRRTPLEQRVEC